MTERFISARGLDIASDPDVRFIKSVPPDFRKALDEKAALDKSLMAEGATTVVYRSSYDPETNQFVLDRQFSLDPTTGGNELNPGPPKSRQAIAYDLFSVPNSLAVVAGSGPDGLGRQIEAILERSQGGRPSSTRP